MSAIQSGALDAKFRQVNEHWRPKVVAALNGQEVKLVKTKGVFPRHRHHDAEEAEILIFEPAEVVNTGDAAPSAFTAPNGVRL